ncbi:MAG: right-handed parallel beta-helix repeat-containing protein [Verrucomicrobiaceae bacterium]|nr:right-handed parallel beta-helix repeat-containing protein [Verrucomicrobiaceae bacterium]
MSYPRKPRGRSSRKWCAHSLAQAALNFQRFLSVWVLVFTALGTSISSASTIMWGSSSGPFFTSTGAQLGSQFRFELGTFEAGFVPTVANRDQWSANWKIFDAAVEGDGWDSATQTLAQRSVEHTSTGQSSSAYATPGAVFSENDEAYVWVYDTKDLGAGAEWALLYDDLNASQGNLAGDWRFPMPGLPVDDEFYWEMADLDTPVFGGANNVQGPGGYTNDPGTYVLQTHAVPEASGVMLLMVPALLLGLGRRRIRVTVLMALAAAAGMNPANAATFTVTSNANTTSTGTFRWAVSQANSAAGADTINFSSSMANSVISLGAAVSITGDTTIDGLSNIGGTAGNLTSGTPHSLKITINNTSYYSVSTGSLTMRGVAMGASTQSGGLFRITSGGTHLIEGCQFGIQHNNTTAAANTYKAIVVSGGTSVTLRNCLISNCGSAQATGNGFETTSAMTGSVLLENCLIGTNTTGAAAAANGNGAATSNVYRGGVYLAGGTNTIRGCVISGNNGNGVTNYGANNTLIENCTIGMNRAKTGALANTKYGIQVTGGSNFTIQNNVISANTGAGIWCEELGTTFSGFSRILNNVIGTTVANGTSNYGNGYVGIYVDDKMFDSTSDLWIKGNTIAYTKNSGFLGGLLGGVLTGIAGQGILIGSGTNPVQVCISENNIYGNASLGIDVPTFAAVTVNDSGDSDSGVNNLTNFPIITSAAYASGILRVMGYARPGQWIELFIADPDSTGFGEGKTFIARVQEGSASDTDGTTGTYSGLINGQIQGTDNTNKFSFDISTTAVAVGNAITATGHIGDVVAGTAMSSEFSGNATVAVLLQDFGDFSGFGSASSIVNSTIKLGALVDGEASSTPNTAATFDDTTGSDDEDGISITNLATPGSTVPAYISHAVTAGTGYLNFWIDFNNNGSLLDAGEHVIQNEVITTSGTTGYDVRIPTTAVTGTAVGARLRLTSSASPGPTGASGYGEVEDYTYTINPIAACYHLQMGDTDFDPAHTFSAVTEYQPDQFGDGVYGTDGNYLQNLDFTYMPANNTLIFDGTFTEAASKKADGMWIVLAPGGTPQTNDAAIAYVDFYDRNNPKLTVYKYDESSFDYSWNTPGQIMVSNAPGSVTASDVKFIRASQSGAQVRVWFTLDCARINNAANWASYGVGSSWRGISMHNVASLWLHVLDLTAAPTYDLNGKLSSWGTSAFPLGQTWYDTGVTNVLKTEICPVTSDFGDYSPFEFASSTLSSALKIGSTTDAEGAAFTTFAATGDDTTGGDDEDGVTLPTTVSPGQTGQTMTVNVSNSSGANAFLNVWIDWDADGILGESGEQIATNTAIATGTANSNRTVTFSVPAGTSGGVKGVRVRLSSVSSPGPDGADGAGEVEDHLLTVVVTAVGNLVWKDNDDNGRFDAGEGVSGVTLTLQASTTTTPTTGTALATTTTDAAGLYQFAGLLPGSYYVWIPGSQFASGSPLFGAYSLVGHGVDNGRDDDWDENGIDDPAPATNGIRCAMFTLTANGEPTTTETGTDSGWDNGSPGRPTDNNGDLTIDFGFATCVQTNLITNGSFETANPSNLTFPDTFPSGGTAIAKTRTTMSNTDIANWTYDPGSYINDGARATDGNRFVYLNGVGCVGQRFTVGTSVSGLTQLTAGQTYTITFDWVPFDASAPNSPPSGNNTSVYADFYYTDSSWSASTFITSFHDFYEPKSDTFLVSPRPFSTWSNLDWRRCRFKVTFPVPPSGQNYLTVFLTSNGNAPKILIDNVRMTASCDTSIGTVGNLVWTDTNGDGIKSTSETGVDKVLLELYRRPASGSPVLVGQTYTSQGGKYFFTGLAPSTYFAKVLPENFAATTPSWWLGGAIPGPLNNRRSSTGNADPNVSAANATDDDASEKGIDNTTPASNGILSPDFAITYGGEPVSSVGGAETGFDNGSDDAQDSNGDMTIDFGFVPVSSTADYGDYRLFAVASSGFSSSLRIGATTDSETFPTTNALATGDDTTGSDDEDGLTLPNPALMGSNQNVLTVNVTNSSGSTAYLNAWADWDKDGVLGETINGVSEQIVTNSAIATGASNSNRNFTFSAPSGLSAGQIPVRVRLTSVSSAGPDGADGNGEVEDHFMNLAEGCTDFALVVVNYNNNTITRYKGEDGTLLNVWSPSGLSAPNYGYRTSDNVFLVANGSSNTITKYNPYTGASLGTLVSSGSGLNFPYQMAVGKDGSYFIANQNAGNVLRFNPTTGAMLGTVLSTSSPAGFVFDSDGNIYLTQNISGGKLLKYSSAGALLQTMKTWPSGENPRGLAWGPDERLYIVVADGNNSTGRIEAMSLPGATFSTFVSMDAGSNPYTGVKWGPDGNLYVVDYGESEMHVYSPAGVLVRTIDQAMSGPHAIAFFDCDQSTTDFGDYSAFPDASSLWSTSIRLGNESDTESSTRGSFAANGDDIDDLDDEDGVTMPTSVVPGSTVAFPVKMLNTSGAPAYLSAWIDLNNNGLLTDAGEQVIANVSIPTGTNGTTTNYNVTIPLNTVSGDLGMRFRFTSASNAASSGAAGTGEVEDYLLTVVPPTIDFGDFDGFASASSTVTASMRIGASTDAEYSQASTSGADGDDTSGVDDEDGVTLPAFVNTGVTGQTLNVMVTNTSGSIAYLNAWIDWDSDGVLGETINGVVEQIATNTAIATGTTNSNRTITFSVPSGIAGGLKGVRVRLTSVTSPGFDGQDGNGEVEDHRLEVRTVLDFGDWNGSGAATGVATSGVNASLRLGALVDAELSVTPDSLAVADDANGSDDEDGVSMPAAITTGAPITIPVAVFNNNIAGRQLQAWIDFNNDGTFTNTDVTSGGERIYNAAVAASAVQQSINVAFTVPVGASVGSARGARFRFSDSSATTPTSTGATGEIEDYVVEIASPASVSGKVFVDANLNGLSTGDSGLAGATVQLYDGSGIAISGQSVVTTGAGTYSFTNLPVGRYQVGFTLPAGYSLSATDIGTDDTIDSDATHRLGRTFAFDLSSGQAKASVDAGAAPLPSLGDKVWWDVDFDGVQDASETTGLSGVTAQLHDSLGTAVVGKSSISNAAGVWTIPAITPGIYSVQFSTPSGYVISPQDQGGNDALDSDPNSSGRTATIDLSSPVRFSGTSVGDPVVGVGGDSDIIWDGVSVVYNTSTKSLRLRATLTATNTPNVPEVLTAVISDGLTPENSPLTHAILYLDFSTGAPLVTVYPYAFNPSSAVNPSSSGIILNTTQTSGALSVTTVGNTRTFDMTLDATPILNYAGGVGWKGCSFDSKVGIWLRAWGRAPTVVYSSNAISNWNPNWGSDSDGQSFWDIANVDTFMPSVSSRADVDFGLGLNQDYGDLVDTAAGTSTGNYETTTVSNGPAHLYNANLRLGTLWDGETAGVSSAGADADDLAGADDEDGISAFPVFATGTTVNIPVSVLNNTGSTSRVFGFIDWNNDGDFADANETLSPVAVSSSGTQQSVSVSATVPGGAFIGSVGARFRVSLDASLGATGWSGSGEVEDYMVPVVLGNFTVGNLVWYDANNDGLYTVDENGISGVTVQIWSAGANTTRENGGGDDVLLSTTTTDGAGAWSLTVISGSNYYVRLPTPPTRYPVSSGSPEPTVGTADNDNNGVQSGPGAPVVTGLFNLIAHSTAIDFGFRGDPYCSTTNLFTNGSFESGTWSGATDFVSGAPTEASTSIAANWGGSATISDWLNGAIYWVEDSRSTSGNRFVYLRNEADSAASVSIGQTFNLSFSSVASTPGTPGTLHLGGTYRVEFDWQALNRLTPGGSGSQQSRPAIDIAYLDATQTVISTIHIPAGTATNLQAWSGMTWQYASVPFTMVGADAPPSNTRFVRVNVSEDSAPLNKGIVVDNLRLCLVTPGATNDTSDYSGFGVATSIANMSLRIGSGVDAEAAATSNLMAEGDDVTNTGLADDEDGISQGTLRANQNGSIFVTVTNGTAATAYLNAWADWNVNGVVDTGEDVLINSAVAVGTSNSSRTISVTPPIATATGNIPFRARLTSTISPGFTGAAGTGEVEDFLVAITSPNRDFGDWNGSGAATAAAFTIVDSSIRMGSSVDAEVTITPDANATADGADEDGVIMPASIMRTTAVTIPVTVFNANTGGRYLHAWIDFNNDGTFTNTDVTSGGERIYNAAMAASSSAQTVNVSFTVPAGASVGLARGARFRFTSNSGTSPTNSGASGETEDYVVEIKAAVDLGDWNGVGAATTTSSHLVDTNLRLGSFVDADNSVVPNAAATSDDTSGIDDEDGVTFSSTSVARGSTVMAELNLTNLTGANASYAAWADFNADGDFADANEQVIAQTSLPTGASALLRNHLIQIPDNAAVGSVPIRFRINNSVPVNPTGALGIGEIEDHMITVTAAGLDYSDAPASYGAASHNIVAGSGIGCFVDTEAAVFTTAGADGDDLAGVDDEDGVFFDTPFVTGGVAHGVVSVRGSGFLSMWIDWNRDGDFTDDGEQVLTDVVKTAGGSGWAPPEVLNIAVPSNASIGATYARVRLTNTTGTGPTGAAASGEVEDVQFTIFAGATVSGRVWRDNGNGIRQGGEHGLQHMVVTLYRVDGKAEAFTVTDAAGDYSFSGLAARSYYAAIQLPSAYALGLKDQGGDDGIDSDFGTTTLITDTFALAAGSSRPDVDAAVIVPPNTISYTAYRTLGTTDWSQSFLIPRLNPAVGSLTAVEVLGFAHEVRDLLSENSASVAASATFNAQSDISFSLPDSSVLEVSASAPTVYNHPLTDSCLDYHGSSGIAGFDALMATDKASVNYLALAHFTGTGDATLSADTVTSLSVTGGGGNLTYASQAALGAAVTVTYSYTPARDFGDWSGSGAATGTAFSYIDPGVKLGNLVDPEASVVPTANASTDDATDIADEDGLVMPASIRAARSVTIPVLVYNANTAGRYLHAWIDFNNDGTFADTDVLSGGERVYAVATAPAIAQQVVTMTFTVPAGASPGLARGVRFRFSDSAATTPTSTGANGEIEDYVVEILPPLITIGNIVFNDLDSNGYYSSGDALLDGVGVQLFSSGNDSLVDAPVASTSTVSGEFSFSVPAGSYFLHIPASQFNGLLAGFAPTLAPAPGPVSHLDDDADQNLQPSTKPYLFGASTGVFTLALGTAPTAAQGETGYAFEGDDPDDTQVNLTLDLGLVAVPAAAPIAGLVAEDPSGSGQLTTESKPVAGVEMALYVDADSDGSLDDVERQALAVTTTDANGQFAFASVAPGDYLVVQTVPAGAEAVADSDGGDAKVTSVEYVDQPVTEVDFVVKPAATSFAQWQEQHPEAGENADGDAYDSLMEYALGTDAEMDSPPRFWVQFAADKVTPEAVLVRPEGGQADLRYDVEFSSDLKRWLATEIIPERKVNRDGSETLRYRSLEMPFARLRVELDADLNGQSEKISHSPVFGWTAHELQVGTVPFAMPLLRTRVFTGPAGQGRSDVLAAGRQYYAEVLEGEAEGHRFEINELEGDLQKLVYGDGKGPSEGTRIAVRPHWTLGELFPVGEFRSAASPAQADRVMFFRNGAYEVYWLYSGAVAGTPMWVRDGSTDLTDRGGVVVGPDEGVFIQRRATGGTLRAAGEVRTWKFTSVLGKKPSLLGGGYPIPVTADQRAMNGSGGFLPGDTVRLWQAETASYSLFTFDGNAWQSQEGVTGVSRLTFGAFGAAVFGTGGRVDPAWSQPVP